MLSCRPSGLPGLALFFLLAPILTIAQARPDSNTNLNPENVLAAKRQATLGENSLLYVGAEYIRNGQRADGSPFFDSDTPLPGSVYYNGTLYQGLDLRYDLVSDQLIINNFTNTAYIQLVKEHVKYFYLTSHLFIFLNPVKTSSQSMRSGFYQQILASRYPVYARREKRLIFPQKQEDSPKYIQQNAYFIEADGTYYHVTGKKTLLDLFKTRKDDLRKYIRDNKLDFTRHFEESMTRIVEFYADLKP